MEQTGYELVKLRMALKNKINNLLASRGILIPKERLVSDKGAVGVLRADDSGSMRPGRHAVQPQPGGLLQPASSIARKRQGHYRPGPEIPRDHLQ